MKILHVITDSNVGGAGIVVKSILENIDRKKYKNYVVLPYDSMMIDRLKDIDNIRLIPVSGISDKSLSFEGLVNIYRVIKSIKPDIIHANSSLSARIAGKIYGKSYIVNTRHCVEPISKNELVYKLKKFINTFFSHKIIAVSDSVYDNLLAEGISKTKIFKVSNGVKELASLSEEKVLELKCEYGITGKFVIGFLGRLEEVKNPMELIEIADKLKEKRDDFIFLVGGIGSLKDDFLFEIEDRGLEKYFKYLSYVEDLETYYNLIDVLVNTSRSEAMPLTLLEAMSLKKPVMAYDVDKLSEIVRDGYNGYLIEDKNIKAYVSMLEELFDDDERLRLGLCAYDFYKEKFAIEIMIEKLERLYDSGYYKKRRRRDDN